MRELKFRITYQHDETGRFATRMMTLGEVIPSLGERWSVIGRDQWSGFKDREKCDIYEGDIIHRPGIYIPMLVRWNTKDGCFDLTRKPDNLDATMVWWTQVSEQDYEIVGNIYANPELLAQEEA